jgi:hypothetical protein
MPTVALRDVPARFLDSRKWAELRAFAKRELIALTYINAPFPDEDNPSAFFWGRDGSFDEAVHCYRTGRALLKECRLLLVQRRLVATGLRPDRDREMIPALEWTDLWPMFATNRASGPNYVFDDVEIHEASPIESSEQIILSNCINWLRTQSSEMLSQKKGALIYRARAELEDKVTHAIFNVAYKIVLNLPRGRPRKIRKN